MAKKPAQIKSHVREDDGWDEVLSGQLDDLLASFEDLENGSWADLKKRDLIASKITAVIEAGKAALRALASDKKAAA